MLFIDSSKFKQGTTLGETKKYVHAPEMIDQEKIDTVILSKETLPNPVYSIFTSSK